MIILTILFLIIDIISKLLISNLLNYLESIIIIKNFFSITYVQNTGAAWSIFSGKTYLLALISMLIIGIIIFYIKKNKPKNKLEKYAYSLILGGALGNLIDRVVYGYVIDFLDFNIFGYHYPIFNFADCFIVIGVILLLLTQGGKKR